MQVLPFVGIYMQLLYNYLGCGTKAFFIWWLGVGSKLVHFKWKLQFCMPRLLWLLAGE